MGVEYELWDMTTKEYISLGKFRDNAYQMRAERIVAFIADPERERHELRLVSDLMPPPLEGATEVDAWHIV